MDSFFVKAIGMELQTKIIGAKIGKLWLDGPFRLIIPLLNLEEKAYLYCSCLPSLPILYLTEKKILCKEKGPEQTELLLRKYLTGALITEVQLIDIERILLFHLQRDTQGQGFPSEHPKMRLIIEIMGRNGNIILTNDQDKILAALRYVPAYKSRYRHILLGDIYKFPPLLKIAPHILDKSAFFELQKSFDGTISLEKFLQQKIAGLSPALAAEICCRAKNKKKVHGEKNALWEAFSEIVHIYQQGLFSPRICYLKRDTARLCPFSFAHYAHSTIPDQIFTSAGKAAEHFENIQLQQNDFNSLQSLLLQKIRQSLTKAKSRQSALIKDNQKANSAEEYRQQADIIMANLSRIKKGQNHLEAENFYSSQEPAPSISIPLDPLLTPTQNAQHYYKRYTKAKKSLDYIKPRLESTVQNITFLSSMQKKIDDENQLSGLEEYKNILRNKKIIHPEKGTSSDSQTSAAKSLLKDIRQYVSVDGFEILVGKNDRGNDALTCKIARKHDLWFHAQDMPGSHVLIRNPARLEQIPFPTIKQAASLAAYFSKARKDTKIMVDYTFAKYVTKPKGFKPGLVLVKQKKSILVSSELKNYLS